VDDGIQTLLDGIDVARFAGGDQRVERGETIASVDIADEEESYVATRER
jgi:hypothetical protein